MVKLSSVAAIALGITASCITYGAKGLYWRPVMPNVVIQARDAKAFDGASQLMVIYGERGRDPLRSGTLASDERVAGCQIANGLCVSSAARHEFKLGFSRQQSLQIRRIDGHGNPIVAAIVWRGPAYPSRVRLTCDVRAQDVNRSCEITSLDA
jgi:hypothetical protein